MARISGRSFSIELAVIERTRRKDHGLAGTQAQPEGVSEADSDAWPGADGERARAEPARRPREDQPGDAWQPRPGNAERRSHGCIELHQRNISEGGEGEGA